MFGASTSAWWIGDTTGRRIMQTHGAADLGETIAVVTMGTANGVILSHPVGPGPGSKELAHRSHEDGREKAASVTSKISFLFFEPRKERPPNEEQVKGESECPTMQSQTEPDDWHKIDFGIGSSLFHYKYYKSGKQ